MVVTSEGSIPVRVPDQLEAKRQPLRILVADDGVNAAEILALFFELEGHQVRVAHDGMKAVELTESHVPNVILLDLGMPVLDGVEAAKKIRQLPGGHLPVIVVLSGLDEAVARQRCAGVSIDRYLSKPVCPVDLRALIAEVRGPVEQRLAHWLKTSAAPGHCDIHPVETRSEGNPQSL